MRKEDSEHLHSRESAGPSEIMPFTTIWGPVDSFHAYPDSDGIIRCRFPSIRCNGCGSTFGDDDDLAVFKETYPDGEYEFFKGCPICRTDSMLMDLDPVVSESVRSIYSKGGVRR